MANDTRTDRIAAALAHVASLRLSPSAAGFAGHVLHGATWPILRGKAPAVATTNHIITVLGAHQDCWTGERAALDVLTVLCGGEGAFEALSTERKARVIRYALAVLTQDSDPRSNWGPGSVAIGEGIWNEVAAVAQGTSKAA